MLPCFDVRNL